ncbi:MAG TPA: amidase family protein [Acidimicrobiales bacterium]
MPDVNGDAGAVVPVDTVHAFAEPPSVLVPGAPTGPLVGTALGVKALIDVEGVVTTAGSPDYARGRPPAERSAPCVEALVAAGATVVGITVSDEMAFSLSGRNVHFPRPLNVAAPGRTPGGSSVGSAAAVAAGLVPLALASDTGGSIRVPASYCGIFGWRPTHGAVSDDGVVPLAPSFDTVGLLAADAAILNVGAEVLLTGAPGPNPVDSTTGPTELHPLLAVDVLETAGPGVGEAVAAAARTLVGDDLQATVLGVDLVVAREAFRVLQGLETWAAHGAWIEATRPSFGPDIAERFEVVSTIDADEVGWASPFREAVRAAVVSATSGGRVLVVPAAAGVAPLLDADDVATADTRAATILLTSLAGLAGAPVVVVPGAEVGGLPVGLSFIGAPGSDLALLAWVATLGAHRPGGQA